MMMSNALWYNGKFLKRYKKHVQNILNLEMKTPILTEYLKVLTIKEKTNNSHFEKSIYL